jgi:hypothetical protein
MYIPEWEFYDGLLSVQDTGDDKKAYLAIIKEYIIVDYELDYLCVFAVIQGDGVDDGTKGVKSGETGIFTVFQKNPANGKGQYYTAFIQDSCDLTLVKLPPFTIKVEKNDVEHQPIPASNGESVTSDDEAPEPVPKSSSDKTPEPPYTVKSVVNCKKCGSVEACKSGKVDGRQRYQCKRCKCNFFPPVNAEVPIADDDSTTKSD